MRDKMVLIWRKMTRIKILRILIIMIRYLAATNLFNSLLDFLEVKIFHTSYRQTEDFLKQNIDRIRLGAEILADKKSRRVYQNIWKYRATHERRYLKGIVDKDQYFDKELIKFGYEEGFVDCGAYHGDTIRDFIRHLPDKNKYHFIVAFEPDQYNFGILKKYIEKTKIRRIRYYELGTWNEKTILRFRSNTEEGCMITADGDTVIHTDTIDAIVGSKKITYIKMDVEGAELKSLEGARNVIRSWHPRLAISIYHSDKDMIEIIEYINKQYPFYKLYVRHYTYFYADTVLYAIDHQFDLS